MEENSNTFNKRFADESEVSQAKKKQESGPDKEVKAAMEKLREWNDDSAFERGEALVANRLYGWTATHRVRV